MPTLQDTIITAGDIKQYMETQDDFSLEVRVYKACKERHYKTSHGGTYVDPVTGKTRQYDVRAWIEIQGKRAIQLAIECKSLKQNYPLVVSRIPRADAEAYHMVYDYKHEPPNEDPYRRWNPSEIYPPRKQVGKATTQVGRTSPKNELVGGDAEVFEKWSQAFASAHEMVTTYKVYGYSSAYVAITFAVLVVSDNTLWVVDYDENGNLISDPRAEDRCSIFVGKEYLIPYETPQGVKGTDPYVITHLDVFTFKGFQHFLGQLALNENYWLLLFPRWD